MALEVVVPELGESVVEATVAAWLKNEGDAVQAGEPVVSLETDKVDLDVPAMQNGILVKIQKKAGEDVAVGEVLALIEAEEQGGSSSQEARKAPEEVDKEADPDAQPGSDAEAEAENRSVTAEGERATPVAKRIAAEKGVDIADVPGEGPGRRVTKRDVETFLALSTDDTAHSARDNSASSKPENVTGGDKPAQQATEFEKKGATAASTDPGRTEERVRMSRRRRTIAERLVEAQQTAAILTTFNEVDMSAVMEMRKRKRDEFKDRHGVSLGFMSYFVKASLGALRQFPQLNAAVDGAEIVFRNYYDIGIAVGADEGLVVPVLRDADRMSFAQIEQAIGNFVDKVRSNALALDDLRGGTFTISNGGVYGSLLSTPILNPPQVGILGLHKIEPRPVVVDNEIAIRPMMYVALSYDHRIVDGREAVQFLGVIKNLIEDPEELLLAG